MKQFSMICLMAMFAVVAMAQKPVITFEETSHNFGTIAEDGGKVSHVFNFTNTGDATLVISNVRASCGCTTPSWPKEPVEPGKTASITVTYNPLGRPGAFTKTVTITANTEPEATMVKITGEVQKAQ
ncbi:MAG TPA: hypothetical protein DEO38_00900 [Bacteroidales bacterium]|nr:hypothetical protein [Bacteroidales bacterium]